MKKCLCLLLSLTMLCLCAGAALAETVALKVWGSQEDQELLAELCEAFAAEHPETTYEFTYGVVGEADAKARYLEDPAAAADVFSYPDDQIIDLVNADALYEVTRNHDAIVAANSVGSVNAASVGGVLYGYPMTADNGYFLYYDRSVVSDEDAGSFDTLLAAAEKAGKKVQIDISNGWYLAGFFLGNGCTLTLDENGNQICDFNSEKGLQAAEAIRAICNHPAYTSGDDTVLQGGMGDAICAGISGTWVAAAMKEKLGDNYAAAKLPTFTVDGEQVQMGSFLGCKILGVNPDPASRGGHGAGRIPDQRGCADPPLRGAGLRSLQPQRRRIRGGFRRRRALRAGGAERIWREPARAGHVLDARRGLRRGAGSPLRSRPANASGSVCQPGHGAVTHRKGCFAGRGSPSPLNRGGLT